MDQQPQPQPTIQDVMSEIEVARVIEQELHRHREELRRYEQQFEELQRLKEELRAMTSHVRPTVSGDRSELDRAMHDVVVALNRHAVKNSLDGEVLQPEVEELAQEFLVEALLNIARHSEATESNFSIKREESWLFVSVFDNGKGNADPSRGSGLNSIRTRVDAMGGHFSVSSPPNRGTLLTLAIPCLSDR